MDAVVCEPVRRESWGRGLKWYESAGGEDWVNRASVGRTPTLRGSYGRVSTSGYALGDESAGVGRDDAKDAACAPGLWRIDRRGMLGGFIGRGATAGATIAVAVANGGGGGAGVLLCVVDEA